MTILLRLRGKTRLISRLRTMTPSQLVFQRFNHTLIEDGLQSHGYHEMGDVDISKWKKVDSRRYGITSSMIPSATWTVLRALRGSGFEAYLVGGCVRDLLLNKVPKDFDVITTAKLFEIKKRFRYAHIIGRRFPICQVHIKDTAIEVSSFDTAAKQSEGKEKHLLSQMPAGCDVKDFLRWKNSMHRDFTINSLFFDPCRNLIYDYANGIADLRLLKLRTLMPAQTSFQEDCARILRGIRIAGRLGLLFSTDTETAIYELSSSLKSLNKHRVMMELNYMLSYGAAGPSILLLQRFNLLEIFFPFHAAYLHQHAGEISVDRSMMLMKLLFSLDKIASSDRPCNYCLWVGLLAFHHALVLNPQDAFVIWVFASVLYRGTWEEGVNFARKNAKGQDRFAPEISGFSEMKSDEELAKDVSQLASLVQDAVTAFTDQSSLSESNLSRFPDPPISDLVFVPKKMGNYIAHLFDVQSCNYRRKSLEIKHNLLEEGELWESRFALGKVILESLSGGIVRGMEIIEELKITEDSEPRPSDFAKGSLVKEHNLLSFDPDQEHNMMEQVECSSGEEMNSTNGEMVLKASSQEKAKKHQKAIETSRKSKEKEHNIRKRKQKTGKQQEKVKAGYATGQEMKDANEKVVLKDTSREKSKKRRKIVDTNQVCKEKLPLPIQETDERCAADAKENCRHRAHKQKKAMEKVRHHKGKKFKDLLQVIRQINPSNKMKEKKNNHRPPLEEVVEEKAEKPNQGSTKEKRVSPLLSSLFK